MGFSPTRSPVSNIYKGHPSAPFCFHCRPQEGGNCSPAKPRVQGCPTETPQKVPIWSDKLLELISWQQPVGAQLEQTCPKTSHLPLACQAQLSHGGCQSWSSSGDLELSWELLWLHTGHFSSRQAGFFYGQDFPEHSERVDIARSFLEKTNEREMHPSCQMHLQTQTVPLGSTFCCPRPQGLSLHPLWEW